MVASRSRKSRRRTVEALERRAAGGEVPVVVKPRPGLLKPSVGEESLVQLVRLIERHGIQTADEAQTFIRQLMEVGPLPSAPGRTPVEKAQDLVFEAWKASGQKRAALAQGALELWPDCADALVVLAVEAPTAEESERLFTAAVAAGERALGLPERLEEWKGEFWRATETRPYLRARVGLARHLESQGDWEGAAAHYRELLRLNPRDDQGVRFLLLPLLLRLGRYDEAEDLLELYSSDPSADWAYHQALMAWRQEGDTQRTRALLDAALSTNPFVPLYLLGQRPLPPELPEYTGQGDVQEAVCFAALAKDVWTGTPGAKEWLTQGILRQGDQEGAQGQLQALQRARYQVLWEAYRSGGPLDEEGRQLAQAMEQHREFHALWACAASLRGEAWELSGINPFLHVSLHAAVENQIQAGDPPEAAELMAALLEAGADRHEAIHLLAGVLTQQIWHMLKNKQPFDRAWYQLRLRYLAQIARQMAQGVSLGRRPRGSEPCPCGSGRRARQCCGDRWPPLPVIEPSQDPQAPAEARRRRPGDVMVLGEGRFTALSIVRHLPQDHDLVYLENAAVVADWLAEAGQLEGAWQTYRQMIEVAAHSGAILAPVLREALLFCLVATGYEEQGLELIKRLLPLEQDPEMASLRRLDMAEFLWRLGHHGEAEAIYRQERARFPTSPRIPFRWAVAMDRAERYDDAVAAYEAVLRLPPQLSEENATMREAARRALRELRRS